MISLIEPQDGRPYATISANEGTPITSLPEEVFINSYKRYGALLLRGFDVNLTDFEALTSHYCSGSVVNESPDRIIIHEKSSIQTVNLGQRPFPLHPELSREPWKPDVCFFWCVNPPTVGGETIICDGVEIVKNLPEETLNRLKDRRLLYAHMATPEILEYWLGTSNPSMGLLTNPPERCPFEFHRTKAGHLLRCFTRPALHKPMFADELAFGNFLLFARYRLGNKQLPLFEDGRYIPDDLVEEIKKISDRLTAPVKWRAGDIIVLDNTRFMHGRNAVIDANERKIATFFGYLKFAIENDEEPKDPFWRREAFSPPKKHETTMPL